MIENFSRNRKIDYAIRHHIKRDNYFPEVL